MVRVRGRLTQMEGYPTLTPTDTREIVYSILSDSQRQRFENNWQIDFAYQIRTGSVPRQRLLPACRRGCCLPPDPVRGRAVFENLGLPPVVAHFANKPRGLVLVTGPTGSRQVDDARVAGRCDQPDAREHIMTIEDPIEFLHQHRSASSTSVSSAPTRPASAER